MEQPKTLIRKLKKKNTSRNLIWVLLLTSFVFSSCARRALNSTAATKKCKVKDVNFKYLTSKAKIDYVTEDNKTGFTANIRIKKDKVIWISASVMGFEGMRCLITPDSVKVKQNVPSKKYYCFGFEELSKKYNTTLSFDIIQSLLVGTKPIKKSSNEESIIEKDHCIIVQREAIFSVHNFLPYELGQLNKVLVTSADSANTLQIDYNDFKESGKNQFPYEAFIKIVSKDQGNSSIDIKYKSANFTSEEVQFPFKVSSKYVRQ